MYSGGGLHLLALVITKYLSDVFGVIHVLAISFLQITAFIRNKSFHLFIILTLLLLLHVTLNPTLPYFYKTNNTIYNTDIFKQRPLYIYQRYSVFKHLISTWFGIIFLDLSINTIKWIQCGLWLWSGRPAHQDIFILTVISSLTLC